MDPTCTSLLSPDRRNKLSIFGVDDTLGKPESWAECDSKVLEFMKAKLKIDATTAGSSALERCYRRGRITGAITFRAVIVMLAILGIEN